MEISVERVNDMVAGSFAGTMGVEFTAVEAGRSVCRVNVEPRMHNPLGILHGGVPYTLADTGMAMALMPMLDGGQPFSTIEIKMSYFRPVVAGEITCETRVLSKGRRIVYLESEVRDATRLVAKATGTYYIKAD